MTTTKAKEILSTYNKWRKGLIDDLDYTPREITYALEVAIKVLGTIKN